jgi:hypothetical protein
MKHIFTGGFTATSHDSAGDEFLAGMICQRDLEDGPSRLERESIELRDNLQKAMIVIRALVIEAGGAATISDRAMAEAYGKDLIEHRDESNMLYKLSVR